MTAAGIQQGAQRPFFDAAHVGLGGRASDQGDSAGGRTPYDNEIIVDLFAGGGGASTGIELALGRYVDVAVNHDPEAVALHQANHPMTTHYICDVFEVDPVTACGGFDVGLLWASPDCKHFSKAKGGKPVSKKIRALADVIAEWAEQVRPRVICMENVEEFQTWGELDDNGYPIPELAGLLFKAWKERIEAQGYVGEFRVLRGCDYGAPTIRKRLFGIFRRDGEPITWPAPTHGAPGSLPVRAGKLKPWPVAADCIDWSQPCPSIFERTRPLAEATLRRIAKGVMRYVVDAAEPFVVPLTHQGGDRVEAVSEPFKTITGANRGEKALVVPRVAPFLTEHANGSTQRVFAADEPLRTQVAQIKGGHFALVSAFLAKHYGGVVGSDLRSAIGTVTSVDHHSLVGASLVHLGHGEGADGTKRFSHGVRDIQQPLNTITASGATAGVVTSHMIKLRGDNVGSAAGEPLHTVSAQGQHHGEVRAFLVKYYGSDQDPRMEEPLHTVTTKDRFGLVTVQGEPYAIVDIGMRMLTPRELYRAQGFPESYIIDRGANGQPLTKTAQVRMCGNSVCPPLAAAIVGANYTERGAQRLVA